MRLAPLAVAGFVVGLVIGLVACRSDGRAPAAGSSAASAAGGSAKAAAGDLEASLGLALPTVARHGYEPAAPGKPLVAVTPRAIVVDGAPVVQLANGEVVTDDQEGGGFVRKLPALAARLGALPRADELQLALDKDATYRVLIRVMMSAIAEEAGWKNFGVLARAGDELVRVPFRLPDRAVATSSSVEDPDEATEFMMGGFDSDAALARIEAAYLGDVDACYQQALQATPALSGRLRTRIVLGQHGAVRGIAKGPSPALAACVEGKMKTWTLDVPQPRGRGTSGGSFRVQFGLRATSPRVVLLRPSPRLFVSVTREKMIIWSITGDEGTLQDPKWLFTGHDAAALAKLSAALADIVARRWPTGLRSDDGDQIVVQADGALPMSTLAPLFGAVRATPDGKPLFPDILLSAGFE